MKKQHAEKQKQATHREVMGSAKVVYYDTCTLSKKILKQIEYSTSKGKEVPITSHLSIGEYCGNVVFWKFNPDEIEAMRELFENLNTIGLRIVGHDDIGNQFSSVLEICPELSIADSVHLATALKYNACRFVTADSDFTYVEKKFKKLSAKCGYASNKVLALEQLDESLYD